MQQDDSHYLDKRQVRRSFERAAATYDAGAVLQREVGGRLLERLDYIRHAPDTIVDIGAGTGSCTLALLQRYKKARVLALDLSTGMLQRTRERMPFFQKGLFRSLGRMQPVCADAEQLPFADGSCDMLFSSLALQWCNDLEQTFREFRRVLRPGGMVLFATFGPDTLKELRASWSQVDGYQHVSRFPDMHDVGDAMLRAGLAEPVMDVEHITLTYREVRTLMRDLKEIGARNAASGRNRGLTGKQQLRAMNAAYEQFRSDDGLLPATYEVVYGHGWVSDPTQGQARPGPAQGIEIPFDSIGVAGERR